MEQITGYVEHIIFRNAENGYTVLSLSTDGKEIPCVGSFPTIHEGEHVELTGEEAVHPSYGPQFQVKGYRFLAPGDAVPIERYLASGAIRGVKSRLAAKIVKKFGDDTFRIFEEEPERLAEVSGISVRMAMDFAQQAEEQRETRKAMLFLQQYGVSLNLAVKIYKRYGIDTYRILRENPYQLADDIEGVGFKIADDIARRVGIRADSDFRIRSGILYVLQQAALEGHTYLPEPLFTARAVSLLGVEEAEVEKNAMDLVIGKKLVIRQGDDARQIFDAAFYFREACVAAKLRALNVTYETVTGVVERRIRDLEEDSELKLDELQRTAVRACVQNGLLVITGGPGTGKTTTINTIIRYFLSEGMEIDLAAPTGRAAKRMSEATGHEAKTIHRLLEFSGGAEGASDFARNAENPLESDVIIIDEMSMVDISLMHALLKAILPGTRLILVGDANQLPSVGPGCVLQDIIDAEVCPVVRLNHIFRQAAASDIIVNAHRINRGEEVPLDNRSREFFFLRRDNVDVIVKNVIQLVRDKLPRYVKAEPFDIQVMTPMRKGQLGVERLNDVLQRYLNPPDSKKAERDHGEHVFRVGDKVMQIRNDYQAEWEITNRYGLTVEKGCGIFNGDMGILRAIDSYNDTFTVEFEGGKKIVYPFAQADELELAYAITIHKAQGSEYPAVVIPLLSGPRMLMNRNLLYTAVTRARKCVVMLGNPQTFVEMEQNTSVQKRYSGLKDRLTEEKI